MGKFLLSSLLVIGSMISCTSGRPQEVVDAAFHFQEEKEAILEVINSETAAAFNRDYEGWKSTWVHDPSVTKTYMDFRDSSITEAIGWKEIDDFVRSYIEIHPEPDPVPAPIVDVDVRLYGTGAWVSFEQIDKTRGIKRETRLMEKLDGGWKIAGMHTTIYGVKQ